MNTKKNISIGEELIGRKQTIKLNDDLSKYDTLVINHYLKKKLYFYDKEEADLFMNYMGIYSHH